MDLYSYTNGDPVNFMDLDGRFASFAYQKTTVVGISNILASLSADFGIGHSGPFHVGSFDLQAINPSVIIPEELCFPSNNYMSRRYFVIRLDIIGRLKHGSELHILQLHPNAKFWDHEFASPTFAIPLQEHIEDYIKNYGGIK